ncbi:TRAP transporter small permease [Cytobacillus purgationiresistens]|uniref:C4-dicarboxylate transporter DctQ subunit n=1 Tax=Cytobacillus purgationiresistens TaxID=863449 RepID=A0ABU0AEL2_9BACI|nr:TRAP transporter small permease [Cytobacillus purgationiresistens]MDQ0269696.1 C4-dicarboxylate transporter DctQ subunit [Cytobacillus purgationiresistens]
MNLLKKLDILEEGVAGILFVGGVAVSVYGVFTRYVLNYPQAWITEIFEFMLVWSIFLGFGMALKDSRHIQVELLFDKLSFKYKRIIACISNIIGAGFSFYLAYSSIELITLTKIQGTKTIDVGLPMWITFLVLPVSLALMGIYFLAKSYKAAKGDKKELTGELEVLVEEMKELSEENKKKGVGA